jgi:enoyl-CoA hydratase/carnithine racemase
MDYSTLSLAFRDSIASLVLLRPELGLRFLRELESALGEVQEKEDTRVLLITAEGPDFCRGWAADAVEVLTRQPGTGPFEALAETAIPVVVALQGAVLDAGLELALVADIRIAADDARFAMLGGSTLPLAGATQRLPRIAGSGLAMAMLLAGEEIDAGRALRAGLVSRVVPIGELQGAAQGLAAAIASRGPIAVRLAKEAVHRGLDMTLDQALRYETDLSVILQTTTDRAEGVKAFLEKRLPHFEGR